MKKLILFVILTSLSLAQAPNLFSTYLTTAINSTDTTIYFTASDSSFAGSGTSYYATIWDTYYANASLAYKANKAEIVLINSRSGRTFDVERGQLSTTARSFNTSGRRYRIDVSTYGTSLESVFQNGSHVGFTNSFTSPVLADSVHQGYATDGRRHYLFGTRKIYKYNSDWTRCDSNTNVFLTIPLSVDHAGDGAYYDGKLYIPIEDYYASGGLGRNYYIGVFDTTGSMSLIGYHDVSAYVRNGDEFGGIEVYNDTIYGAHYNASAFRKLTRFNISTFARIDTIPLSEPIMQNQGVVYHNDTLFCATNNGKLYSVDKNNGNTTLYWVDKISPIDASHEGIDWSQTELRWLIDNGGIGFEKVYYYSPYGYQTGSIINKYSVSADSVIVGKFRNPSLYTGTTLKVSQRAEIDSLVIPYHTGHTSIGNFLFLHDGDYSLVYPRSRLHLRETVTGLGNVPFLTLQSVTTTNTSTDGASIDFINSSVSTAVGARIRSTRVATGALSDLRISIAPTTAGTMVDMAVFGKDSSVTLTGKLKMNGIPSDSTGLTTGTLYFRPSDGIVRRKY